MEDELAPELDDNPGTTRGAKLSVFHLFFFPCWVNCGFLTADPLIGVSVFFAGFPSDRTASLRVIAQSRRGQDRERFLALPRLFALLRWSLPPLWGSWISAESPFLSLNPVCSACALMLWNQTRILFPLEILK